MLRAEQARQRARDGDDALASDGQHLIHGRNVDPRARLAPDLPEQFAASTNDVPRLLLQHQHLQVLDLQAGVAGVAAACCEPHALALMIVAGVHARQHHLPLAVLVRCLRLPCDLLHVLTRRSS